MPAPTMGASGGARARVQLQRIRPAGIGAPIGARARPTGSGRHGSELEETGRRPLRGQVSRGRRPAPNRVGETSRCAPFCSGQGGAPPSGVMLHVRGSWCRF